MQIGWNKRSYLCETRGPGVNLPALGVFVAAFLVFSLVSTKPLLSLDFKSFQPYTAPTGGGDSRAGSGKDSQFDAKRAVERFQAQDRTRKEGARREEENRRDAVQVREVEQNVGEEKKVSQAMSQQQQREAAFIEGRMSGVDTFTMGKDGSVWHRHFALLVHAWNILALDRYGNESRSELTNFTYNSLFNPVGMDRATVNRAGQMTKAEISGITYEKESPWDFLSENRESGRVELETSFHPTGNRVVKTETFGLKYTEDGKKVIAQEARITPLTGPDTGNTLHQKTTSIVYDGDNVTSSEVVVTDLGTGTVTKTITQNEYTGNRVASGITESTIQDPVQRSFTQQTTRERVRYGGGTIEAIDVETESTTRAVDEAGNIFDDYVTTTKTTSTMGIFFGIPNPVRTVSVTNSLDNVAIQTTESRQTQNHIRDPYGNLLGMSGTEAATTVNADRSVIQTVEGSLDFVVQADQPILVGRSEKSTIQDLINEQNITSSSRLDIRLGSLGEVLEGTRIGRSHAKNLLGTVVSDSEFIEQYDRAAKANALGLVRRESTSRTVNSLIPENISVSEEKRVYTQSHDTSNRVLDAFETVEGLTTDTFGAVTRLVGSVDYDVGKRTNQVHAVSSQNKITSIDPVNRLYTESTQTNTFESDPNTGRALRGLGLTESFARRRLDDGTVLEGVLEIHGRVEETLLGLAKANGFGTTTRKSRTEVREIANHQVTDREEILTQIVNDVGKVQGAQGVTRSVTQDLGRTGVYRTTGYTQTDYRIIDNSPVPTENRTVEVTVNRIDSSYRVVARHDVTRHDAAGRILPIDKKDPKKSGYELLFHEDKTLQLIPKNIMTPEQLFQKFFGSGRIQR